MFKMLKVVLSSLVSVMLLATPVVATPASGPHVKFQKPLITDVNVLFDRAEKGVTDLKDQNIVSRASIVSKETGKKLDAKIYSTTQLNKVTEEANGEVVNTYATTTFAVATPNDTLGTSTTQSYDGSNYNSKWDGSISVRAYSTVYWTYSSYGGLTFCNMAGQSLTGGWAVSDSTVSVSNRYFTVGQSGPGYTWFQDNESGNQYPSSLTYSYYVPSTWTPVQYVNGGLSSVGMHSYATLVRGGSSWNLTFDNYVCH
ncbi:hypothetical protein ACPUYX_00545 [Desulfosporosinus sp. SYSU MS00001]|uniref:hypothetical protein n=1 Tax=Desulfosporosinus sp. SYSU MS00001 TaxID=3416284 RepID=UPI003CF60E1D